MPPRAKKDAKKPEADTNATIRPATRLKGKDIATEPASETRRRSKRGEKASLDKDNEVGDLNTTQNASGAESAIKTKVTKKKVSKNPAGAAKETASNIPKTNDHPSEKIVEPPEHAPTSEASANIPVGSGTAVIREDMSASSAHRPPSSSGHTGAGPPSDAHKADSDERSTRAPASKSGTDSSASSAPQPPLSSDHAVAAPPSDTRKPNADDRSPHVPISESGVDALANSAHRPSSSSDHVAGSPHSHKANPDTPRAPVSKSAASGETVLKPPKLSSGSLSGGSEIRGDGAFLGRWGPDEDESDLDEDGEGQGSNIDQAEDEISGQVGLRPGPLRQEQLDACHAKAQEGAKWVSDMAKEWNVSERAIGVAMGALPMPETAKPNPWNIFQCRYGIEHPKPDDGEFGNIRVNSINERERAVDVKTYKETISAAYQKEIAGLGTDARKAFNRELREWNCKRELQEGREVIQKGLVFREVQRLGKDLAQRSAYAHRIFGIRVFGFVVYPDNHDINASNANHVFGGSQDVLDWWGSKDISLNDLMRDFQTRLSNAELESRTAKVKTEGDETPTPAQDQQNWVSAVFREMYNSLCAPNGKGKDRMAWKNFITLLDKLRKKLINWPNGAKFPNIETTKVFSAQPASYFNLLASALRGDRGESTRLQIVDWDEDVEEKYPDPNDIPLVVRHGGGVIATVFHSHSPATAKNIRAQRVKKALLGEDEDAVMMKEDETEDDSEDKKSKRDRKRRRVSDSDSDCSDSDDAKRKSRKRRQRSGSSRQKVKGRSQTKSESYVEVSDDDEIVVAPGAESVQADKVRPKPKPVHFRDPNGVEATSASSGYTLAAQQGPSGPSAGVPPVDTVSHATALGSAPAFGRPVPPQHLSTIQHLPLSVPPGFSFGNHISRTHASAIAEAGAEAQHPAGQSGWLAMSSPAANSNWGQQSASLPSYPMQSTPALPASHLSTTDSSFVAVMNSMQSFSPATTIPSPAMAPNPPSQVTGTSSDNMHPSAAFHLQYGPHIHEPQQPHQPFGA